MKLTIGSSPKSHHRNPHETATTFKVSQVVRKEDAPDALHDALTAELTAAFPGLDSNHQIFFKFSDIICSCLYVYMCKYAHV
jgi:hypothetical protein